VNRRYERPEVKQITKQWVKENCYNITDRDMGLLRLLADRRLLRRDQIERLYREFPSTDYLNKRLNILYRKHVIDKIYPPVGLGKGSSKQHICLDRAGVILLGIEKYNKPIKVDKDGNRSLPLGWEHIVMLNEYECRIREFFNGVQDEVLMYNVEEPLYYNDTKIIPDIFCLIKHNGKGYLFFIEVDLGTEDIPYVKKKIDSYVDYYTSRAWLQQKWSRVFKIPTFPRVLIFTENNRPKRVNTLREYTKEMSVRFHIDEHDNLFKVLNNITKGVGI
jgi:hypothetical protein